MPLRYHRRLRIVLITGISGSGKSVALNVLEDAGYYCVDNLPPALLPSLVKALVADGTAKLAVAVDARSAQSLVELPANVRQLKDDGHDVKPMFLTANTHSLVARFSETRRSHPLSHQLRPDENPASRRTLIECILEERERLSAVENLGHVIDTSELSANKLRAARWQWRIYRDVEDLSLFASAGYMLQYFKHAVAKRKSAAQP